MLLSQGVLVSSLSGACGRKSNEIMLVEGPSTMRGQCRVPAITILFRERDRSVARSFQMSVHALIDEKFPRGLRYKPELVSAAEEAELLSYIQKLPFAPFQFGQYQGKRRVVFFGARYDYSNQRLEKADAAPSWVMPYARRVEGWAELTPASIGQILVTEYESGAGIGWHRDKKHFDEVFGLSLLSACPFRFRRKTGAKWERFTLDAQPRSLYAMSGDARHIWEHSIAPVEQTRYSITFRTMNRK